MFCHFSLYFGVWRFHNLFNFVRKREFINYSWSKCFLTANRTYMKASDKLKRCFNLFYVRWHFKFHVRWYLFSTRINIIQQQLMYPPLPPKLKKIINKSLRLKIKRQVDNFMYCKKFYGCMVGLRYINVFKIWIDVQIERPKWSNIKIGTCGTTVIEKTHKKTFLDQMT